MGTSKIDHRAIDDPALIAILAAPIRQEIVDTLASLGSAAGAADLALHLGRHADGLYYHLKILCKAGLIVECDGADAGERHYRLAGAPSTPLRLAYRTASAPQAAALRKFAHGLVQVAEKDFGEALDMPGVRTRGAGRQLWAARSKGWVSRAELAEVNALLERLCELTSGARTDERDQLVSCTFVLSPHVVQPKRRGDAASAPDDGQPSGA